MLPIPTVRDRWLLLWLAFPVLVLSIVLVMADSPAVQVMGFALGGLSAALVLVAMDSER